MSTNMKTTAIFNLILLTFVLMAGCTVGPKFKKPQFETPEQYRSTEAGTDSLINLAWWQLFQDSTLDTLVNHALQNNREIRIAASRIEPRHCSSSPDESDNPFRYHGSVKNTSAIFLIRQTSGHYRGLG